MMRQFEGETADDVWRQAAEALVDGKDCLRSNSRLGRVREYLHCGFHLRQPRQRWVLSRRPAINPAFGIAELVWILQGRNDAGFLTFWNPLLPKFVGSADALHGAYGFRLRRGLGIDQIDRAYHALAANPDSRQVVLQIWDAGRDMPHLDGTAQNPDIPCNVVAMPKIRDGRLEWLQVMRSNDLYLGTPHNFIQFTSLQEIMAGWLGVELGAYIQISDSLHLYEYDMAKFAVTTNTYTARNTDTLCLPKTEFDRILPQIGAAFDALRADELTRQQFMGVVERDDLPEGWHNLLRVVAADAARRRKWAEEMEAAMSPCVNPALSTAWRAWTERRTINHRDI